MENLLQNKYVLYIVLFFAVTTILGYLSIGDYDSIVIFVAIVLLASYFSKNMIIILGLALLGTNIIYANNGIREGLKNKKKKKKKKNKRSGFANAQQAIPSSEPAAATEEEEDEEDGEDGDNTKRIDHAATMEQAYDNLNNMIGKGGMKNLTKDTQHLMNQQENLMKQLKDFAPLMNQASNMLEKLGGMDNLQGLMGKLTDMSKIVGGKKK